MEYYSAIKKDEIMPFAATWMDLEIIILSEVSQTENITWYHLHVEYNQNDTSELTYKTDSDLQVKLNCLILKQGENVAGSDQLGDWD